MKSMECESFPPNEVALDFVLHVSLLKMVNKFPK